jgi:hypothetical protein
MIFIF